MAATRTVTPATVAALALFGLAFVVSVGFVVATGGLALTAAARDRRAPTAPSSARSRRPRRAPTPTADPTVAPTPAPTPSADRPARRRARARVPTPDRRRPSPTPEPTAKPTPKPTSARFALLKACPGTPDCYIYVVRSGDNLFSIAKYFGVSLNTVKSMNPWTKNGLVAGRELRIPPPTR